MPSSRVSDTQKKANKHRALRNSPTAVTARCVREEKRRESAAKHRRSPEEIEERRRQGRARQYEYWLTEIHRRKHGGV